MNPTRTRLGRWLLIVTEALTYVEDGTVLPHYQT